MKKEDNMFWAIGLALIIGLVLGFIMGIIIK